jgi:acetoin utilization protein AcuB
MARVKDIMSRKVETVDLREQADTALNLMRLKRIRHLVVKDGPEIVGILSERDIGGTDREVLRRTRRVLDVMTPHTVKAEPDMPVRQAANLMRGRTIGCLPVVENGKLVGIVTVSDILELVGKGIEHPVARTKRWILKRRAPREEPRSKRGS